MSEVKCPKCGHEFEPEPKNTQRLRCLKVLYRALIDEGRKVPEMTTREITVRVKKGDVGKIDIRSIYKTLQKLKREGKTDRRRIEGVRCTVWRITESGVGYLRVKDVVNRFKAKAAEEKVRKMNRFVKAQ